VNEIEENMKGTSHLY